MPPLLSVVVPFYGVEDYIGPCLESLRAQALNDVEVILVDDGSQDRSGEVAQSYIDADPRFHLITQQNSGLGVARNTGAQAAVGNYLTFIDSDDLVTRRGFERLVASLERTGSSIAAGNTRRFNNSSGVKPSWSHRVAFRTTRIATHITEFPPLARDRMVWNKVYRRTFWDAHGYSFPAIRYEDYPVTLAAHMDAVTVDVFSEPVYFWRERESGDSITQQAYTYANLLDRVVSAEMVVDIVRDRDPAVELETRKALAETDMLTLLQAFATVPEDEADHLRALSLRMESLLTPSVLASSHRYNQIQIAALRSGDLALLRKLAAFRANGGLAGAARAQRRPSRPWRLEYPYPGLGSSSVPRHLYRSPRSDIQGRTTVSSLQWTESGDLVIEGTAEIRTVLMDRKSTVAISLGSGSEQVTLPVERFVSIDSHGDSALVGFRATAAKSLLARMAESSSLAPIQIRVKAGMHTARGVLSGALSGSPTWPDGYFIHEGVWAQPATTPGGALVVTFLRDPWRVTDVAVGSEAFEVTLEMPQRLRAGRLEIRFGESVTPLQLPVEFEIGEGATRGQVSIPYSALVDHAAPDDPFQQTVIRPLQLVASGRREPLLWAAAPRSAGAVTGMNLLRVTRSQAGRSQIADGPVRLSADSASIVPSGPATADLVIQGRTWTDTPDVWVSWRRFLSNSDIPLDAVSKLEIHGRDWRLVTSLNELLVEADHLPDHSPLTVLADWTLFSGFGDNGPQAVVPEPFLDSRLPLRPTNGQLRGVLRPKSGTLHLQVRPKN